MATVILPAYGESELTFTLAAETLAQFPSLIGRSAATFQAEIMANHPRPGDVKTVLIAGLVDGGMGYEAACGVVDRLSRQTNDSGLVVRQYALAAITDALAAV